MVGEKGMWMESEAREPETSPPPDDWPWAYEVRRAARQRALARRRVNRPPLTVALAMAALVYPFLALPLVSLVVRIRDISNGHMPGVGGVLAGILGYPFSAAACGIFLAVFCLILSAIVWLVATLVTLTLRNTDDDTGLALHVATWTALWGTTCLMGLTVPFIVRGDPRWLISIAAQAIGPGLAIPLAQYAAAWSLGPGMQKRRKGAGRFGIYQLLVATAWVALGLALLKGLGLLTLWSFSYLAGWTLYGWITMGPVLRMYNWREQRRLKRSAGNDGG